MIPRLRKIAIGALIFGLALGACSSKKSETAKGAADNAGGLTWNASASWTTGPPQSMRSKTYIVKAVSGDQDDAECAVFYFGSGLGGDLNSNLHRWAGQFEQADGRNSSDLAVVSETESNGLKVTTIELDGIYKMSGPMMEVKEKKLGYRLMGAIVEGPQGLVFFKLVGPEKTVKASAADFAEMIKTVKAVGA